MRWTSGTSWRASCSTRRPLRSRPSLRTALCLDPEIDEAVLTGGVVHGLGHHYRRALMGHLTRQGLYLTSERTPDWLERRITVTGPGEADSLAGAGIAACAGVPA